MNHLQLYISHIAGCWFSLFYGFQISTNDLRTRVQAGTNVGVIKSALLLENSEQSVPEAVI